MENLDALLKRAYNFADLSGYKFNEKLIIRAGDLFFYTLIRTICKTLRWEIRGVHYLDQIRSRGHQAIFTFWHNCIFSATWFWRHRGIVVMSSRSRDAEFTARFIQRFGYGTARGSKSRGAGRAMAEMSECLEGGVDVAFTIDGPKGPAFIAKAGAVTLSRHTGQAILPFHIGARRYISLRSWDRLQIPLPFTKMITVIGEPIYVPREARDEDVAACQQRLQSTLENLKNKIEVWRINPSMLID